MISISLLVYAGFFLAVAEVVCAVRRYRSPEARMGRAWRNREVR